MDITRNLFYSFRGPTYEDDLYSHRQLENNVTKGLITVLDKCKREVVLKPFLKLLDLKLSGDVVFSLQRRPIMAKWPRRRIVLAIAGGQELSRDRAPTTIRGRPDAWIYSEHWAILVESKIGKRVHERQLHSHANQAGWEQGSYRIKRISWHDVHAICKSAEGRIAKRDSLSRLLLTDWLTYLEFQNMVPFERLEASDFDFYNLPAQERRALLPKRKERVRAFATRLADTDPAKAIVRLYGGRGRGEWKFGHRAGRAWFNVGGGMAHRGWHATVFFEQHGLDVSVLSSDASMARNLYKRGLGAFTELVNLAAGSKDILLACRRAWYKNPSSRYKGQKIRSVDEPLVVNPSILVGEASKDLCAIMVRAMIQRLLEEREKWRTEMHIRKAISRDAILRCTRVEQQIKLVAEALRELSPALKHLLQIS